MSMITLENTSPREVTVLTNTFIDNYMPQANGDFVKVYIYLLRVITQVSMSFTLEHLADRLLCTERDIIRALNYWNTVGLLSLETDTNGEISKILLHSPRMQISSESAVTNISSVQNKSVNDTFVSSSITDASSDVQSLASNENVKEDTKNTVPKTSVLTPERIKELKENEDIVSLLYITEQYLGKTLTPTEMQKILFFYDELNLSAELIEYLIEYCVGRNHKSMRYIETVALAWAKEGISTVEMAKNANSRYSKDYFTILKSLGITNRNPVDTEISMMDTWLKEYGFTMDIIQEACNRTILQTGQPSFQYADKILSGWQKKNVHNLKDIQLLDAEHKKRKLEKAAANSSQKAPASTPNRFNNFQQREYNFEEYEKRLLNQ